jgi:hypothetical protein
MVVGVFGPSLPKEAVGVMGNRRLQFGVDTRGCKRSPSLLQTPVVVVVVVKVASAAVLVVVVFNAI